MKEPLLPIETAVQKSGTSVLPGCPDAEIIIDLAENGAGSKHVDQLTHVLACADCFSLFQTFRAVEVARAEAEPWWSKLGLTSVAQQIKEGAQLLPEWFAGIVSALSPKPAVAYNYRRSVGGTPISLDHPDLANRKLQTSELRFTWKPVEGASTYRSRLTSEGRDLSDLIEQNPGDIRLRADARLEAGATYRFQVTAELDADSADWLATPVELTCTFGVLSSDEQVQLEWARANTTTAPVAAMLTFYCLERYADAQMALGHCPQGGELDMWREAVAKAVELRRNFPEEA
ncbi:MAG: hypothetical protein HONBIEJF_00612 [Fimbriimonadaceae bacterium]|nr:hypothetical protein [Fimbriimonadaceae bacterium]